MATPEQLFQQGLEYFEPGNEKRTARALELLEQAADHGHAKAMYFASKILADGWSGTFDRKKAFSYVQRAAELGDIDATYTLGFYFMEGGMGNLGYRDEILDQMRVERDEERGLSLYLEAAAHDHPDAVLHVARFYADEDCGAENALSESIKWYEKGIKLGEPSCMIDLADMHVLGIGVPTDSKRARALYKKARRTKDAVQNVRDVAKQRIDEFDRLPELLNEWR